MNSYKEDIALAVNGDCDAFARLYAVIYKELYAFALYSLRNEADAQDAVSDAVIDAFAGIKRLRDEQAFKAWFFRILSAKIKRKQKEYANMPQYVENSDDIAAICSEFESIELQQAMKLLGEEERLVLSLSAIGGYKSKEIAKMCKMKDATVRSKISRAKQKLANILQIDERSALNET
ncbi:MAG: RNA polymerase sigma factor [Oscillospiraceae bacterium]|nr:RNA polymerase sigma factor [Oscillospiraceae bacterium]